jgi:hypothetical protein
MKRQGKRDKEDLVSELVSRLDDGLLEPMDGDSAELRELLSAYACLERAVEEPTQKLQKRVRQWVRRHGSEKEAPRGLNALWSRWLPKVDRRWYPALSGAAALLLIAVLLVPVMLLLGGRLGSPAGGVYEHYGLDRELTQRDDTGVLYSVTAEDVRSSGAASSVTPGWVWETEQALRVYRYPADDFAGEQGPTNYLLPGQAEDGETSDGSSDRMIVRRASLALIVQDTEASFRRLQEIAADQGGWISSLETGQTVQGSLQTSVSIQVPVEAFNQMLAQLKAMDAELLSERITSQDVTADYVDLDARARNLELAEQELQELLEAARERGEKAQGILSIYDELVGIRQQIEQLKGQMNLLEHSAAMARIDVALIPEEVAPPPPGFDAGRVLSDAWKEVVHTLEEIATALLWALAFAPLVLPPLLVVALVVWLVARRLRRRTAEPDAEDK